MLTRHAALLAASTVLAACGGVVQFAGAQPFEIAGTAAPPIHRRARLENNRIVITEKIQFEDNQALIKPESSGLLHEIADVIRENPQVKKISIEGHASSEGNPQHNQQLSADRATAVMNYLIRKENIDPSRLTSRGWGSSKPIASNDTEEGREKNRRVEFLVIDHGQPQGGSAKAAKENKR